MNHIKAAVVTVSDTCSAGTAIDSSGPALVNLLKEQINPSSIKYELIPDDSNKIEGTLIYLVDVLQVDIIITTGGTGFGPRDVTPEATKKVIHREAPQLALVMALYSLEKTKFAALSRAICGIRNRSLIINMPGSKKAVVECFQSIVDVIPHALHHMQEDMTAIRTMHKVVQSNVDEQTVPNRSDSPVSQNVPPKLSTKPKHVCPHHTNSGAANDRNSPFPMVSVEKALSTVFQSVIKLPELTEHISDLNLPPFRASIKDGYAVKSTGGLGIKRVIAYVSAGDDIYINDFADDECLKINTGAPVPIHSDCIIQVEDTEIIEKSNGIEQKINIKVSPSKDLDIRPIGCDLEKGESLFSNHKIFPGMVTYKSLLASVGKITPLEEPQIGVISTGDELIAPGHPLKPGQIYDSNMTMLVELLKQFGFSRVKTIIAKDNFESLKNAVATLSAECPITICTGGVSMGDKDFVKAVVRDLGFNIHFGRVNMKPGKPMTFAANPKGHAIFGLPGNPVSSFVTFHLFVLPALRYITNYNQDKLQLPVIMVELLNDKLELDPRPEYARATVTSKRGKLYAEITGDQISSRLKSIDGADVLLHLPARTDAQSSLGKGTLLKASVLKHHFISKYE